MRSPGSERPIYVIGMMGAGKSTVGSRLASALGRAFVDLDATMATAAGAESAGALLVAEGEPAFRRREAAALRAIPGAPVVATGGGVVTQADSVEHMLATGTVVYLRARAETLRARLLPTDVAARPLLQTADPLATLTTLLARRRVAYEQAHLVVDTDGLGPDELAREVRDVLEERAQGRAEIEVPMPSAEGGPYTAIVYRGTAAVRSLAGEVARRFAGRRSVLVADEGLGARVDEIAACVDATIVRVPGGEGLKQLAAVETLAGRLVDLQVDRQTVLLALGGGALGDAVGFLAATLLRGIDYAHLPTTLLSMVDSSIGGKTAVNLPAGKNLLGAFHQPRLVFADLAWLETLPARDRAAGLGEVLKHALLDGEPALQAMERDADSLRSGPVGSLFDVVCTAVAYKAAVVAADPRERVPLGDDLQPVAGRVTLNLGHTIGHALERASHDPRFAGPGSREPLRHGEAIALGLVAEARLGARWGLWPEGPARLEALLPRLGIGRTLDEVLGRVPRDVLLGALRTDKKRQDGSLRVVLLAGPGRPVGARIDGEEAVKMLLGGDRVIRSSSVEEV